MRPCDCIAASGQPIILPSSGASWQHVQSGTWVGRRHTLSAGSCDGGLLREPSFSQARVCCSQKRPDGGVMGATAWGLARERSLKVEKKDMQNGGDGELSVEVRSPQWVSQGGTEMLVGLSFFWSAEGESAFLPLPARGGHRRSLPPVTSPFRAIKAS